MSPAIIFIDEIDSVGRIRGGAKGNDERDQTLNQMLSEMDGFDNDSQVIVMAATNRRDILDPALVRPGRFDRIIYVPLPDYNGRIEILEVHLAKRPHAADIDLHELAFETSRYSGAQLANLVNLAATIASQAGRGEVASGDLMAALEFERLGPERAPYSGAARRRLAVQEAATALACTLLPAIEPVVQVTIVPREKYPLGQTVLKANEQRELTQLFTRRYLEEQLLTALAGACGGGAGVTSGAGGSGAGAGVCRSAGSGSGGRSVAWPPRSLAAAGRQLRRRVGQARLRRLPPPWAPPAAPFSV